MTDKKKIYGIIITLLGGVFWGVSGACGQYLFEDQGISANWLVPIRLTSAGVLTLIYYLFKDRRGTLKVWHDKRNILDLMVFAMAGMMFCQYTYFVTIELSNAGTATVLQYVSPVIIMIIVCFSEKRVPKTSEILAIVSAIAGVFLLATHGNIDELIISKKALIIGLLSSLAVVVYNIQPKRLMKQFDSTMLLGWAMFIGGSVLTMMIKPWNYKVDLNWAILLVVFVIVIFGTIFAFSFYMIGVKLIGPAKASLYASIEPVTAAILSALWLGVPFSSMDVIGFLFIISTIFIITVPSLNKSLDMKKSIQESME